MQPASATARTGFDPLAADLLADPYPSLAALRRDAPVAYATALDMWVVTRHADVTSVFTRPEIFSSSIAQAPLFPLCDAALAILKGSFRILPVMSNADGEVHARVRRRLQQAFSPRRMKLLAPVIATRTEALLDTLAPVGKGDLVAGLCYPLPALTIFAMIGFPEADSNLLKAWCADKLVVNWGRPTEAQQIAAAETMVAFFCYCEAFVARRRAEPADDLTTDLMNAPDDSAQLTDQEIASIIFGLSFAGHETTTNLAANCLRRVLENGLWQRLLAEPSLIPGAIEETLRYDSSVITWRRVAREEAEIGGITVPAGAKIFLSLAAANRDPAKFDDPDAFDPARGRAGEHLSFGKGAHFCLGATLARIEVGIVLRQMLARFPTLELLPGPLGFPANISFRGPLALWARWDT